MKRLSFGLLWCFFNLISLANDHKGEQLQIQNYLIDNNFEAALKAGLELQSLMSAENDTLSVDYADVLLCISSAYSAIDGRDITNLIDNIFDIYDRNNSKLQSYQKLIYVIGPPTLTSILTKYRDYTTLIHIGARMVSGSEKCFGENSLNYGKSLSNLCKVYYEAGRSQQAETYGLKALDVFEKCPDDALLDYKINCNYLQRIYSESETYDKSEELYKREIAYIDLNSPEIDSYYLYLYDCLADIKLKFQDYPESINIAKKVRDLSKKVYGENSKEYGEAKFRYGTILFMANRRKEGIDTEYEALQILEQFLDKEENYIKKASELASNYALIEKYSDAARLSSKVLEKLEVSDDYETYIKVLEKTADYKYYAEDFSGCFDLYEKALSFVGSNDYQRLMLLSDKSRIVAKLGNVFDAVEILEEAVPDAKALINVAQTSENQQKLNESLYLMILDQLASQYSSIGNTRKKGLLMKERMLKDAELNHQFYPEIVWKDVENDILYGKEAPITDEAREFLLEMNREALNDITEFGLEGTLDHASILASCANTEMFLSNYEDAYKYLCLSKEIYEGQRMENSLDYANLLQHMAMTSFYLKDYSSSLNQFCQSASILEQKLGKHHPELIWTNRQIAMLKLKNKEKDTATDIKNVNAEIQTLLINAFSQLSSSERVSYWEKHKDWFQNELPLAAWRLNDTSLYNEAYSSLLLSKGLLLCTEQEFNRLMVENGDKNIVDIYYSIAAKRRKLNSMSEKPVEQILTIEQEITKLEKTLVKKSKEYGDYTKNMSINWNDVRKKLKSDEAAIEFVTFKAGADSVIYAAYVLKNESRSPELITLFEEKDLKKVPEFQYYTTQKLSEMIWKPLEMNLQGKKTIYFSPDGLFHTIAVESLPDYASEGYISDRYSFYRLSSTRELVLKHPEFNINKAVLYGGLQYDMPLDLLVEDASRYSNVSKAWYTSDLLLENNDEKRSGVGDLPETLNEVNNICNSLKKTGISSELFSLQGGTEGAFKNMNGREINILHLATHGFYYTAKDIARADNLSFVNFSELDSEDEKAMFRSGLILSGANFVLKGQELPVHTEDGVLTAKEISLLDFKNLDLVVLSACQTGLGQITSEGVFGLQRGFKKAGASSVLMSLWKVQDKATQVLMSRFYENLVSGMSKQSSLKEAQQFLRGYSEERVKHLSAVQKDKTGKNKIQAQNEIEIVYPFSSPECWAAFILIDALK